MILRIMRYKRVVIWSDAATASGVLVSATAGAAVMPLRAVREAAGMTAEVLSCATGKAGDTGPNELKKGELLKKVGFCEGSPL